MQSDWEIPVQRLPQCNYARAEFGDGDTLESQRKWQEDIQGKGLVHKLQVVPLIDQKNPNPALQR